MMRLPCLIRLSIAILSAIVLYLLIKSKLILEPVFTSVAHQGSFALFSFAVVAGFSETFVPNILRRVEGSADAIPPQEEQSVATDPITAPAQIETKKDAEA